MFFLLKMWLSYLKNLLEVRKKSDIIEKDYSALGEKKESEFSGNHSIANSVTSKIHTVLILIKHVTTIVSNKNKNKNNQ